MKPVLVMGLGKLGLPMACVLSEARTVYGYDIDQEKMQKLREGSFTTWEPRCRYSEVIFEDSLFKAAADAEFAFICVNTPTYESDGTMDMAQVEAAFHALVLTGFQGTAVISSTVMPGTAQNLSTRYGMKVLSNPVWIAMGSVITDLPRPPVLLIGHDDTLLPAVQLSVLWRSLPSFNDKSPLLITDTRTAEFLKLAHNAWCCIKMSWMGQLGDQATKLGVDMGKVTTFFKNGGERPGEFWKYGPPFGGPCFPRDLEFWLQSVDDNIGMVAASVNENRFAQIEERIPQDARRITILGSGYKYGIPVMDGSLSSDLADYLMAVNGFTRYPLRRLISALVSDTPVDGTDFYIVSHNELRDQVPEGVPFMNLWDVPK